MRRSLLGTTLFETLGFTYLGPVDGHDVEKVTGNSADGGGLA